MIGCLLLIPSSAISSSWRIRSVPPLITLSTSPLLPSHPPPMLLLFHTLLPTLPTLYRRYKIFIFLVMINIFLAILNDAYIAI